MKPVLFFVLSGAILLAGCSSTPSTPGTYVYHCESGARVTATYPDTDSARVTYLGREHNMRVAISASGARYADDQLVWWTKGAEAILLQRDDSTDDNILERCRLGR